MSFTFGGDVDCQFLRRHDLDLVVLAHQVVKDGYDFFAGRELVTMPVHNYCYCHDARNCWQRYDLYKS